MRVLITGFDAFDKADVNPSQQAVERINAELLREAGVPEQVVANTHTLATCCNEAWHRVQAEVGALSAGDDSFAVVLTGFAGNRNKVCLERFALNTRAYRINDNNGHRWQDEYIDQDAPDALRCKLPLVEMAQSLCDSGFEADVSNYAGTFVCNETYFRAMQKWQDNPKCAGVVFVHIPEPLDYLGTNPDQTVPPTAAKIEAVSERAIAEFARAFAHIIKLISMHESKRKVAAK